MKAKARKRTPEVILREGEPAAVIIDMKEYQEMLERLEDVEDLKALEKLRKKPLKFRTLEDFLREYSPGA